MKVALTEPRLTHSNGHENHAAVIRQLDAAALDLGPDDLLVLPEHFDGTPDGAEYEEGVSALARRYDCHVVGGSHHAHGPTRSVNAGVVAAPDGTLLGRYEKLRPYATERSLVSPGTELGQFEIGGLRILVLVCADFWFSDLFDRAAHMPDLVVVPALSVTRKPTPEYSRALWRHLAIARAYEFGTYVGVSDWAHDSRLMALSVSGVSGFADPTEVEPTRLFREVRPHAVRTFELDRARLADFRADRLARGFFWRSPPRADGT